MSRLLNKLNVLVRSSVTQAFKPAGSRSADQEDAPISGKALDKEIARLRDRINRALEQQDRTEADIRAMDAQIAQWDQQADDALRRGDEATARQLVQQIQRDTQQCAMLEADLDQQRRSASELIRQVNELDAIAALAQQNSMSQPERSSEERGSDSESLADRLRKARQTTTSHESRPAPAADSPPAVDEQIVEDDLARRRNRLSL